MVDDLNRSRKRLLPHLFSGFRWVIVAVIHIGVSLLLFQSYRCLALVFPWFLCWIAVQEPSAPSGPRHEDVAEFMNAKEMRFWIYRRFWVPDGERWWVIPLLSILLPLPGFAFSLKHVGVSGIDLEKAWFVLSWAWCAIPLGIAVIWLVENMMHIPIVYGPAILFYLVALTYSIVREKEDKIVNLLLVIPAILVPLYALDLLRVLRRAWYDEE